MMEGLEVMALVDTGPQVSTLTEMFCLEFRLRSLSLGGLLYLKGTTGFDLFKCTHQAGNR